MRYFRAAAIFLLMLSSAFADEPLRKLPLGTHQPKLAFRLMDGSRPAWASLKGKVVVLDFWASWCGPCVASIDHLNALATDVEAMPVRIYSITYEPRAKASAFLAKHPMKTAVGLDDDLATFQSLIAWGIPMSYVFDGNGDLVAVVSPTSVTAAMLRDIAAGKTVRVDDHPGWKDPAGAAKYFREQLEEDRKQYGKD